MQFQPKTETEIIEENMLPAGEYPFEIGQAEDKISAKGNEMIEITMKVFKEDGSHRLVTDYLMEKMLFKLKHCCETCGLHEQYKNGTLKASDFEGKTGKLSLIIQEDKKGKYPPKNTVKDYIVPEGQKIEDDPIKPDNVSMDTKEEDEIPFALVLPLAMSVFSALSMGGIA